MKTSFQARCRAFISALLMGSAMLSLPARAEVVESVAEGLMRDSGLWEQVADLGPMLKQGFEEAARRPPAGMDAQGQDTLRRLAAATDDAFSPVALRLIVRRELAARLAPEQLPAIQAWLGSALGRRVTAVEVAESAKRGSSDERVKAGERSLAAASSERRLLLQQFVDASRSAEATSSAVLNLTLATQLGIARAMGRADLPPLQALRQQLEPQRQKMQQDMAPAMLALAADLYSPLVDADLRTYVAFQQSAAGRHLSDAVIQANNAAVAESAEELGRLVAPR